MLSETFRSAMAVFVIAIFMKSTSTRPEVDSLIHKYPSIVLFVRFEIAGFEQKRCESYVL